MAWRQESWAEIVARARSATPHTRRPLTEVEDRESLARRAQPWTFERPGLARTERGLVIGEHVESVEIDATQLYHLEPIDPWPSIAVGWVDRGESYSAVMTPLPEQDAARFAETVEAIVTQHGKLAATRRGWLEVPVIEWERVDALPGERGEGPAMRGYRMAPEVAEPIVARRTSTSSEGALWAWIWARLLPPPRRVDAVEIVLTQRFLYVRTRRGARLRLPIEALRTSHRTPQGDTIYVLGRNTELLLVRQRDCALARALDARLDQAGGGNA